MRIGIIREGKTPPDKRVPFTPEQCKLIQVRYPDIELLVQRSPIRAFNDKEYIDAGINLVDNLETADVIFGVKEVNIGDLLENKTYFFFSHTIKEQPYNRNLLKAVIAKNVKLVDYECLTDKRGSRLVGFGRYAGIVGTYNAFLTYGKRSNEFEIKPAHKCFDRNEMEAELPKVKLPNSYKIAITGLGRVAGGSIEILEKLGIRKVSSLDFVEKAFNEPVYTQLSVKDYFKLESGESFQKSDAYSNPEKFESDFMKFAEVADMYIPCHYWDAEAPYIFSEDDLKAEEFNIKVIADISCDIAGPIPSTIRPSTIADPIYTVNRSTLKETGKISKETLTVMAVDNLPCELPKDASEDFGRELLENILPNLFGSDNESIIDRAAITEKGNLKPDYEYLRDYLNGEI